MPATVTAALIDPIADPATPRITYYDDGTGERIELSTVTLMNWAAKTANMLRDEFGLAAGDKVAVLLPSHWQTAAVLLGAWWLGCEVTVDPDAAADAHAALVTEDRLDAVNGVDEVAALSLDPFGRGLDDLPVGVTDYATTVRVHGDDFFPSAIAGDAPALAGDTVEQVLARARERAEALGIAPGARLLSQREWDDADALVDGLLAPLAARASLVQVRGADPAALDKRRASEKVTADL